VQCTAENPACYHVSFFDEASENWVRRKLEDDSVITFVYVDVERATMNSHGNETSPSTFYVAMRNGNRSEGRESKSHATFLYRESSIPGENENFVWKEWQNDVTPLKFRLEIVTPPQELEMEPAKPTLKMIRAEFSSTSTGSTVRSPRPSEAVIVACIVIGIIVLFSFSYIGYLLWSVMKPTPQSITRQVVSKLYENNRSASLSQQKEPFGASVSQQEEPHVVVVTPAPQTEPLGASLAQREPLGASLAQTEEPISKPLLVETGQGVM
jgi:hypothetical protein